MSLTQRQISLVASLLTADPDVVLESNAGSWDDINRIISQPTKMWARIHDISEPNVEHGVIDDPGVYPSNAGGSPRQDRTAIENLSITIVFEIDKQLALLFDRDEDENGTIPYSEIFEANLSKAATQYVKKEIGEYDVSWDITREGNLVTYLAS